ncbi:MULTISPECIES: inositol 2-dehydrogenase [unclassified Mesorhizobium]|uniref:inositol 2-dehydrogenase n=1 Tax=unclassified Mesorhizobium TaxID=325217 RepID=UPI000FCA6672|nr:MULTISPECIES: inositol 2-dehydrogenase [unclassified Mesorhizobium]RUW36809.1 inositol 2-dehydrogenase [Mesorhizobium sp. M1E.F.Ca.ET.041.01.1.1]RWD84908.1 MAG: inositol 2-dehydrogenase [Mesorhizobium sp.]RWD90033.1 MAG: inositol 2-dehydrogenase [Mesorhizobium sp.]TIV54172.1 MAG: inositol 2-dehydrogenase [Mesorhizobium sp.]
MPEHRRLQLALFGAGRMGTIHAANIARHPGAALAAVIDPDITGARQLAETFQSQVRAPADVFDDPDIDAIVIASAASTHPELIDQALARRKAIFCEKPLARDLDTVRSVVAAVEASGTPFLLAFNRRFDLGFSSLASRLQQGEAGSPELVLLTSRDPGPPPLDYIVASGGILRETTIHDIDMARWLTGEEPESVHAMGASRTDPRIAAAGHADTVIVTLKMPSGTLVAINNSWRATYGYDQRVEVLGANGMLQLGNVLSTPVVGWNSQGGLSDRPQPFFLERYSDAYRRELDYFVSRLQEGGAMSPSAADGLKALEIAEAAEESMKSGQVIRLS